MRSVSPAQTASNESRLQDKLGKQIISLRCKKNFLNERQKRLKTQVKKFLTRVNLLQTRLSN